jgi:flagellar biosynthetic protein FliQ
MSQAQVVEVVSQALVLVAKVAGPVLVVALVVGLAVSVFQSLTQINDYTLTFAPKLLAIALVLALAGHWMLSSLVDFAEQIYAEMPRLVSGALGA